MIRRLSVDAHRCIRGALTAAALTLAVAGCGGSQNSALPLAKKRSWEDSFNSGNSAAVAALYAPDAELVLSGAPPIRGPAAIRAELDSLVQSGVKASIDVTRSEAVGDLAYFYGSYSVSSKQSIVERGTYLEVWRRHGKQWLIELDVNATGAPIKPTS
jgi:ketosteroid isomerase-like protein